MKEKLRELVEERQEDINMITKMLENNLKKMNNELQKVHEYVKLESSTSEKKSKESMMSLLDDKVGLDEVQDALKRITENFNYKIEQVQDHFADIIQNKLGETTQSKEALFKLCAEIETQKDSID